MNKKIFLILFAIILIAMPCYAGDLGVNFKIPDDFEEVELIDDGDWDGESPILVYDRYELKTDSNIFITVEKYDKESWDGYTNANASTFDFSEKLDNNMVKVNHMGEPELSYGSVYEVIDFDGTMYIVDITFLGAPLNTNDQVKKASNYLEEFNKLNNVKPIKM